MSRNERDLFKELSSGVQAMREHRDGKVRLRTIAVHPSPTYQIKVTLLDTDPPIWRRLRVSGGTSLARLDRVIQTAMGWTNSHAHMFAAGVVLYGDPDQDWDEAVQDERDTRLAVIANKPGATLIYEYDMGDSWRHEVAVEEVAADTGGGAVPVCIAGERACPPEDCGGVHGYYDMLERLRDPGSANYEETRAWIEDATGGPFDPEALDLNAVNRALKRLRWGSAGGSRKDAETDRMPLTDVHRVSPQRAVSSCKEDGMDSLGRLEEIGFRRVGHWQIVAGKPVVVLESAAEECDVLYAFVAAREVLYVGKTVQPLSKRMYGYQRPGPTQATNLACHGRIGEHLSGQQSLAVFARCNDGEPLRIGSFAVSLAAGLEDAIVRELQPPWNRMGKRPSAQ